MATKDEVLSSKVKHKGIWKYSDVYAMVFDWLKSNKYDVGEGLYKEVVGEGKDIDIEWEAEKKVTDYFKFVINIKWKIIGMKDAEVEVDGKVQKMNKGEIGLTIKANFVSDYDGKWVTPMHKLFRGIYEKYIIDSNVKQYKKKLEDETTELINDIKSFLRIGA